MAKHDQKQSKAIDNVPPAQVVETPPETTTAAPEVTLDAPEVSLATTDAPASPSETALAVAAEESPFANLTRILPVTFRKIIRNLKVVTQDDLEVAADTALTGVAQKNFVTMLDRMNPEKPGVLIKSNGFRVPGAVIFHGAGNNEARPELLPPGGIFSSDGRMLMAPPSHAGMLKVPDKMMFYVLVVSDGHAWWPPRDKTVPLPPDVNPDSKSPICRSIDQKVGDRYGSCDACPNLPWKNGKKPENGSCNNETTIYFVLADFSGIYSMTFAKTAIKEGAGPIKKKANQWKQPWDRQFQMTTRAETNDDKTQKWYVPVSAVFTDPEHSDGIAPTEEENKILLMLNEKILADVYYQQLAHIYNKAAGGHHTLPAGAEAAQTADMNDLANSVAIPGGAAPAQAQVVDYSKQNV